MTGKYPTLEEFIDQFQSVLDIIDSNPNESEGLQGLRDLLAEAHRAGLSEGFDQKNSDENKWYDEYKKNTTKLIFDAKTKKLWDDILFLTIEAAKIQGGTKQAAADKVYRLANILGYHSIPGKAPRYTTNFYKLYTSNKNVFTWKNNGNPENRPAGDIAGAADFYASFRNLANKKISDSELSMDDVNSQALLLAANIAAAKLAKDPTRENIEILSDAEKMNKLLETEYTSVAFEFYTYGKSADELKKMAAQSPEKAYDDYYYFNVLNRQLIYDAMKERGIVPSIISDENYEQLARLQANEREMKISDDYNSLSNRAEAKVSEFISQDERGIQKHNKATYKNKAILENLVNTYKNELGKDASDLKSVFDKLSAYIALNNGKVTNADTAKEVAVLSEIHDLIDKYTEKAFNKINSGQGRVLLDSDILDTKLAMLANISHFLDSSTMGGLIRNRQKDIETGCVEIDASETEVIDVNSDGKIDRTNDPLFSHDPSFEDVQQKYLGDCYYLAALSRIASEHPEKIREAMVDNGNGTVTVRLFGKGPVTDPENPYAPRALTPIYVTVNKIVPKTGGASGALWVQMFEKAYAASGLRLGSGSNEFIKDDFNKLYDYYKKNPNEQPSHSDCPWLVDINGTLHKWEPHYSDIEAGESDEVTETLLGEDFRAQHFCLSIYKKDANEILVSTTNGLWGEAIKRSMKKIDPNWSDIHNYLNAPSDKSTVTIYQLMCGIGAAMLGKSRIDIKDRPVPKSSSDYSGILKADAGDAWHEVLLNIMTNYLGMNIDITKKQDLDGANNIYAEDGKTIIGTKDQNLLNDLKTFNQVFKEYRENTNPDKGEFNFKDKRFGRLFDYIDKPEYFEEYKNHPERFDFLESFANTFSDVVTDQSADKKYSGKYTVLENTIWKNLNYAFKHDCMINAGTEQDYETEGLASGHAYSLIGTFTKKVGNAELRFVRLRNPWGEDDKKTTPVYTADKSGNVVVSHESHPSDGTFDMELGDFVSAYGDIYYNGKPDAISHLTDGLRRTNAVTDKKALLELEKNLQQFERELKASDGGIGWDSDEYKKLKNELSRYARISGGYYLRPDANVRGDLHRIYQAADKYLRHCQNSKALFNPEKRAARVRIAEALKFITDKDTVSYDPKEQLKFKLAEKFYNSLNELTQKSGQQLSPGMQTLLSDKWSGVDLLKNNESFISMLNSKTFYEGLDMLKKSPEELVSQISQLNITQAEIQKLSNELQHKNDPEHEELNNDIVIGEPERLI